MHIAKIMTNFAADSRSNNKIRQLKSKQEFFFFLKKKHDLLHSTVKRSERESYCTMHARDSAPEVWETLSAYSIFHTPSDDEVMHAYGQFINT